MKVLVLSSLRSETGNCSTARRIRDGLTKCDVECVLAGVHQFGSCNDLDVFIKSNQIHCVVGIHAWRAGYLLWDCSVPYCLVLGGTDVNEHYKDSSHMVVMTTAIKQPECEEKTLIQPQAVSVSPSSASFQARFKNFCDESNCNCQVQVKVIFLLAGGMRPVKDVTFLMRAISDWHERDPRIHLFIIGPELDERYASQVKLEAEKCHGVVLVPGLPTPEMHACMRDSFALLNTSLSEGMATSLLEAMALGVPVLARDIEANSAIIHHRKTGLLFSIPDEFVSLARELMVSPSLRKELVTHARKYVEMTHSFNKEKRTYFSIIQQMVSL
ncbi:glycosyltransferase 1 domain-containing protein 1 isoform X2 [Nematostella vectensis]|uniref:glycosyltransferase 1 domain-containing protein 1 isoform X2 n=1 Tax=Nematostella vectensis TaxID=45351 RepID=UPI0013906487|nr:glycosyltransferase 1 domain-containing protein 1 isoform X2 [Nematostella vectensis]